MKKGFMKGLFAILMVLGIGVFAGNVATYNVSAEETAETEKTYEQQLIEDKAKELIEAPFNVLDAVLPHSFQRLVPHSMREQVRGCMSSAGGISGGVALGVAAVALFKKKKD